MIAKVIVDIPTMQTNRSFDYEIPEELINIIQKGMRVEVPFGRRKIQGFVEKIINQTDFDGKMKKISNIIDLEPVLNQEMLDLSEWMAMDTYSFRISCLQTMLPSVMRAKYHQIAIALDENTKKNPLFTDGQLELTNLTDNKVLLEIKKLRKESKVEILYQVENKARKKTISALKPKKSLKELKEIKNTLVKNAKAKKKLVEYFIDYPEVIPTKELLNKINISRSIVTQAIKSQWLEELYLEQYRKPANSYQEKSVSHQLNVDQKNAVEKIVSASINEKNKVFLVEGVTGSGKTEVYLDSIENVLQQGKTALMLVPEIGLTPQMVQRVSNRFHDNVAVLHSGLSRGERYDEWRRIERGDAKVVVGARSAIFAPLKNLGIIIIDEEHEASYKQEENPRYHARNVAIWRGSRNNCPVVLGSATPSLESRARGQKGVYEILSMTKRVNNKSLPKVEIVDMRDSENAAKTGDFSQNLIEKIKYTISRNEQVVLLLNKRGYATFVMCRECGFVAKCPNCDVSMTMHKDKNNLKCHYCGHEAKVPTICPNCKSKKIRNYGTGTQNVQEQLQSLFPNVNILRMDVDTTSKKGSHSKILNKFAKKEANILLGTQMIAKGLDFPDVTLVGVINADTTLSIPNFKASEKTFQLLTQVSGRAGRAEKEGQVVIQTFNPEHYAIQLAAKHDYENFYRHEMYIRHRSDYPPFYYATQITIAHQFENNTLKKSFEIVNFLKKALSSDTIVLGPTPSMISRIKNKYYYQIILKYKNPQVVNEVLTQLQNDTQGDIKNGFKISIDNDPQ